MSSKVNPLLSIRFESIFFFFKRFHSHRNLTFCYNIRSYLAGFILLLERNRIWPILVPLPSFLPGTLLHGADISSSCFEFGYAYHTICLLNRFLYPEWHSNSPAQPLEHTTAAGGEEPTSRCQTFPSIWTFLEDKIRLLSLESPFSVSVERWPFHSVGSLRPTFVPATWVVKSSSLPPLHSR